MKFFHVSDLHIGKRVNGFSMLDDQRYILKQMIDMVKMERPDGVLIAGDLYDKAMPAAEAVELVDAFLTELVQEKVSVWVISGNHDSAERVAYGRRMLEKAGVFVAGNFDGALQQYVVTKTADGSVRICKECDVDEGTQQEQVTITMMPFIKPAKVRGYFPEETIETTNQAVAAALRTVRLEKGRTNILMMHQFMTGASVCESEEVSVGGSDSVDAEIVKAFDYVALGHLHGPQRVSRDTIRYSGSPLKYSFSEAKHEKSVTVVETGRDAQKVQLRFLTLLPRLDLREIKGPIEELLNPQVYGGTNTEDYLHVTLTDEGQVLDAIGKLREVYPNIMRLDFQRTDGSGLEMMEFLPEEKTPEELFGEFFLSQNGQELSDMQTRLIHELMGEWKADGIDSSLSKNGMNDREAGGKE